VRAQLRRQAPLVAVGSALVLALALLALLAGSGGRGALDPDAYDPEGSHALAVLLRDQGVDVRRTTDVPTTLAAATATSTVFVPLPGLLSTDELAALAGTPGDLVVAGADPAQLGELGLDVQVRGGVDPDERDPRCAVPWVANAGRARVGGWQYASPAPGDEHCYDGSLLVQPAAAALGDGEPLTNGHLGDDGNAALGIGLLGRQPLLVWLVPAVDRAAFGERPLTKPDDLLPAWVPRVRWYLLLVVAVVVALWRGRRLGRVVVEPLPVVVRASETVEGHGRLYHAAGARGSAADALRAAAVRRLEPLAHGGRSLAPEDVVGLVTSRTGRQQAEVRHLLYGPPPADDAALVRLADALDGLVRDALHREGAGS
jgi:hypothetical protein